MHYMLTYFNKKYAEICTKDMQKYANIYICKKYAMPPPILKQKYAQNMQKYANMKFICKICSRTTFS